MKQWCFLTGSVYFMSVILFITKNIHQLFLDCFCSVYLRSNMAVDQFGHSDLYRVLWHPQRAGCPLFQDPVTHSGPSEHLWASGNKCTHGNAQKQAWWILFFLHYISWPICYSLKCFNVCVCALCVTSVGCQYWQHQIQRHHGGGPSKWLCQTIATKWHVSPFEVIIPIVQKEQTID